nr:UDP-glucuronosyl and UDP-glucosyl transferase [Bacopa monnieri]
MDNLHIAVLASPGMGHLIPVLVLGNRLAASHNVRVTVLSVTATAMPPESIPHIGQKLGVEVIQLPPVDISHLVGPSTQVVTLLCLMVREALPLVRSAIAAMDHRPDALIVDHFGTAALLIAAELGMAKYVYVPSTAWFAALTTYCPVLDQEVLGQYVDQKENLKIPGCKPVRPEDVVDPMLDRDDQQYLEYLKMGRDIPSADGILLNSWEDLEPKTLQALREDKFLSSVVKAPVYPIGPLRRPVQPECSKTGLIDWLDRQPNQSVLFVSFGSGGMLSAKQITELAWGLELSRQRFVWVVRPPTTGRVDDAFFDVCRSSDGTPDYLPQGFSTRTHNVGLLVPNWAPQVEILNHPSVGGFLSHCGWNSTLESITSGIPMIAWPLYAEQRLNATLLVEELGVAVRPKVLPTKEVVGREEIEEMVRTLMERKEGEVMRDKVKQLKISASRALRSDGSSHKLMAQMLSKINASKKLSKELLHA